MNSIFKKLIIVSISTLAVFSLKAQQESMFGQYMFNKLLVNPAYAGSQDVLSTVALNRTHWQNVKGAPRTTTVSLHTPLRNKRIGLGLHVYTDKAGPLSTSGVMASYAYRVNFMNGILSLGLQAGFKNSSFDKSELNLDDESDIYFNGDQNNKFVPDANFGVYYYTNTFYAGLSATQLVENKYAKVVNQTEATYSKLSRHYYAMVGSAFFLTKEIVFKPSALLKYVKNSDPQLDLNASFLFKNKYWLGVGYRTEKIIDCYVKMDLTKQITLGYAYDISLIKNGINSGSHEIMLGFNINLHKKRSYTPRYF